MKCRVCGKTEPFVWVPTQCDWDWFTGYLSETVHFCPHHKQSDLHKKLLKLSRIKPEIEDLKARHSVFDAIRGLTEKS